MCQCPPVGAAPHPCTAQTQGMPEAAQHLLSCWPNKNQNTSSELALLLRALIRACHTTWVCFYRACGGCAPASTSSASNWGSNPSLSLSFYALLHVNLCFLYTYYSTKGKKQVTQVWLLHGKFYRKAHGRKYCDFCIFFCPRSSIWNYNHLLLTVVFALKIHT